MIRAKLLASLAAWTLLFCLFPAAAPGEPILDLQMTRTDQPIHLGDERLVHDLTVSNKASPNPAVGTTLTCKGTPPEVNWFGKPPPDFTVAWLREGIPIPGATSATYTATAEDVGKSIQCVVTGTNDADGLGSRYAPVAFAVASLPPTVVDPAPLSTPPSGTTAPGMNGPPIAATPSGTATATEGSKILTDVVTAEGTGTFTNGSSVVQGVTTSSGLFEADQAADGGCVAPATKIDLVEETVPEVFKVTLSNPATCSAPAGALEAGALPFGIGHELSGECIPPGTKILKATLQGLGPVREIEMDVAATCSKADITITGKATFTCTAPSGWTSDSTITWSFQWLRSGQEIPGATNPTYTVQSADAEPPSRLQCRAMAEDEEGQRAVALFPSRVTRPNPLLPLYSSPSPTAPPTVEFENQTSGEVMLEFVAPEAEGVSVFKALGPGWQCEKTLFGTPPPATMSCKRSDTLAPQDFYPALEVVTALGQNPPLALVTEAEVFGGNAPLAASATDEYTIPEPRIPFGFKAFEVEVLDEFGDPHTQAGGHPFSAGANIALNTHERPEQLAVWPDAVNGSPREVRTQTPPGFVGNPQALPELCTEPGENLAATCPPESAVGEILVESTAVETPSPAAIYGLEPEHGQPAQFAFQIAEFIFTLNPELRPEDNYAIDVVTQPLPKIPEVFTSEVVLCGFGAIVNGSEVEGCRTPTDPEANELSFLTNPTRCDGEPVTRITANSWEGEFDEAEDTTPELKGCDQIKFEPTIDFKPTSTRADSPTGMDVVLEMPTNGLEGKDSEGNRDPEAIAQANLEGTEVTLPEGMAVNPSSASGRGACTLEQLGMSATGVPNDAPVSCPESAKLGTLSAETPLLDHPLPGTVYLAQQGSNPFNSLLALYLVIDSPEDGILIKLAGKVSPDPVTGQLTVTFDGNPQAPLAKVELHFAGGNRAALINPPTCGTYAIQTELTPWTAADPANPTDEETVQFTSPFQVSEGPNGGPCPTGALEPKLRAWTTNPVAGALTPFILDLSREDGTQRFRQIATTTPPGLVAYLKGVPYCPDAVLAAIPTAPGTGQAQITSPACPQASQVGTVITGAGAGPDPLFLDTGKVYLTGPYKGAPLSLAVAAPAVTGPFDLGNVMVRTALNLDPTTAQITAVSDPIPTILEGIPLDVREVRINVDRPNFTVAPTNCEPMAVKATVTGEKGATAELSDRFQVGGCEQLGFKPDLKLRLKGSPKRGSYQKLTATLTTRGAKDANIARASVALPHSIFLAQEHIRTVCTRVQFAADSCPKGSIYGKATAISPLLDYPLNGTVYLRSSSNPLPDMVIAFKGPAHQPIEIELAGRIDSKNGGIRNTFDLAPDAPVSRFTLQMRGGKKSLLVASRNLCKGKAQKASVKMDAHNGRERDFGAPVKARCGGKKGGGGKGR